MIIRGGGAKDSMKTVTSRSRASPLRPSWRAAAGRPRPRPRTYVGAQRDVSAHVVGVDPAPGDRPGPPTVLGDAPGRPGVARTRAFDADDPGHRHPFASRPPAVDVVQDLFQRALPPVSLSVIVLSVIVAAVIVAAVIV